MSVCALILFFGRLRAPRPPPFADHWDQGFRSASRAPCLQNCSVPVGWPWPTPRRGKEGINAQRTDQPKYSASTTSKTV